ncbi:hypothetical protein B0H66DRAFT_610308 [Apodospora peruviana]|uniref:Uncharacterized protein n=1 Tax=Apodospora peruviana TaxID=516989 RepID=A0AAE0MFU2_9PEZI|nr:hypothetical protein B0H66DRAFT_610308 [Apodospora peruviana]
MGPRKYSDEQIRFVLINLQESTADEIIDAYRARYNDPIFDNDKFTYIKGKYTKRADYMADYPWLKDWLKDVKKVKVSTGVAIKLPPSTQQPGQLRYGTLVVQGQPTYGTPVAQNGTPATHQPAESFSTPVVGHSGSQAERLGRLADDKKQTEDLGTPPTNHDNLTVAIQEVIDARPTTRPNQPAGMEGQKEGTLLIAGNCKPIAPLTPPTGNEDQSEQVSSAVSSKEPVKDHVTSTDEAHMMSISHVVGKDRLSNGPATPAGEEDQTEKTSNNITVNRDEGHMEGVEGPAKQHTPSKVTSWDDTTGLSGLGSPSASSTPAPSSHRLSPSMNPQGQTGVAPRPQDTQSGVLERRLNGEPKLLPLPSQKQAPHTTQNFVPVESSPTHAPGHTTHGHSSLPEQPMDRQHQTVPPAQAKPVSARSPTTNKLIPPGHISIPREDFEGGGVWYNSEHDGCPVSLRHRHNNNGTLSVDETAVYNFFKQKGKEGDQVTSENESNPNQVLAQLSGKETHQLVDTKRQAPLAQMDANSFRHPDALPPVQKKAYWPVEQQALQAQANVKPFRAMDGISPSAHLHLPTNGTRVGMGPSDVDKQQPRQPVPVPYLPPANPMPLCALQRSAILPQQRAALENTPLQKIQPRQTASKQIEPNYPRYPLPQNMVPPNQRLDTRQDQAKQTGDPKSSNEDLVKRTLERMYPLPQHLRIQHPQSPQLKSPDLQNKQPGNHSLQSQQLQSQQLQSQQLQSQQLQSQQLQSEQLQTEQSNDQQLQHKQTETQPLHTQQSSDQQLQNQQPRNRQLETRQLRTKPPQIQQSQNPQLLNNQAKDQQLPRSLQPALPIVTHQSVPSGAPSRRAGPPPPIQPLQISIQARAHATSPLAVRQTKPASIFVREYPPLPEVTEVLTDLPSPSTAFEGLNLLPTPWLDGFPPPTPIFESSNPSPPGPLSPRWPGALDGWDDEDPPHISVPNTDHSTLTQLPDVINGEHSNRYAVDSFPHLPWGIVTTETTATRVPVLAGRPRLRAVSPANRETPAVATSNSSLDPPPATTASGTGGDGSNGSSGTPAGRHPDTATVLNNINTLLAPGATAPPLEQATKRPAEQAEHATKKLKLADGSSVPTSTDITS